MKENIDATLKSSGYPTDSAVSINDLKELARQIRAAEILDGTVSHAGNNIHVEARLVMASDVTLTQPLAPVDGKDITRMRPDAVLSASLTEARRQLESNAKCIRMVQEGTPGEAVKAAMEGIKAYPRATIVRTCLANAYIAEKASPDSLLRVASEIIQVDPDNVFAWRLRRTAYTDKKDDANAVAASIKLMKLLPNDQSLGASVINLLANSNEPEKALPIIDDLLSQNQGDPALLQTKWRLLLKLGREKDAIPVRRRGDGTIRLCACR